MYVIEFTRKTPVDQPAGTTEEPSAERTNEELPSVKLRRSDAGIWSLELPDSLAIALQGQGIVEIGQRVFRMELPLAQQPSPVALPLAVTSVSFLVASDEEYVRINVRCGEHVFVLDGRSYNYLMLVLARAKLSDLSRGISSEECGWVYQDELERMLAATPQQVNVDVFRIRKQFVAFGIDSLDIIQRRPRQRQLRIGVPELTVERL